MPIEFDANGRIVVPKSTYIDPENVVFKCNWNDCGWKGICSKTAREYNVSKRREWCCHPKNPCSKMIENGEKGFPCLESELFVNFKMDPGANLKDETVGEERHIYGISPGKVAFLTTLSPEYTEKDRYFIGLLDIEKVHEDRYIIGNKETSVVIPPKIKILFWNYFKNKDESKKWSSGLFRKIGNETVLKILIDLKLEFNALSGYEKEKQNLDMLIKRYNEYITD